MQTIKRLLFALPMILLLTSGCGEALPAGTVEQAIIHSASTLHNINYSAGQPISFLTQNVLMPPNPHKPSPSSPSTGTQHYLQQFQIHAESGPYAFGDGVYFAIGSQAQIFPPLAGYAVEIVGQLNGALHGPAWRASPGLNFPLDGRVWRVHLDLAMTSLRTWPTMQLGHTPAASLCVRGKDQNATISSALTSYSQEFRAKGEGRPVV